MKWCIILFGILCQYKCICSNVLEVSDYSDQFVRCDELDGGVLKCLHFPKGSDAVTKVKYKGALLWEAPDKTMECLYMTSIGRRDNHRYLKLSITKNLGYEFLYLSRMDNKWVPITKNEFDTSMNSLVRNNEFNINRPTKSVTKYISRSLYGNEIRTYLLPGDKRFKYVVIDDLLLWERSVLDDVCDKITIHMEKDLKKLISIESSSIYSTDYIYYGYYDDGWERLLDTEYQEELDRLEAAVVLDVHRKYTDNEIFKVVQFQPYGISGVIYVPDYKYNLIRVRTSNGVIWNSSSPDERCTIVASYLYDGQPKFLSMDIVNHYEKKTLFYIRNRMEWKQTNEAEFDNALNMLDKGSVDKAVGTNN